VILLAFAERREVRGSEYPCAAFRWTLQAGLDRIGACCGFVHQHQLRSAGDWHSSHTLRYEACLRWRTWRWGFAHWYYDGPHCSLSLGPFLLCWGGSFLTGECKRCMPN